MLRPKLASRKPPPPRRSCTNGSVSDPHSDILSRESMIYIRSRAYYFRRCKKKRPMPTNIESLPTDLLFEILLRMPADHLYERARLVCRRWCHIIHSHAFINAQMHGATYGLLLSPPNWIITLPRYVTADADGGIHTSKITHLSKSRVVATCNGLELEAKGYQFPRLVIVNPATKQSFHLPPLPTGVNVIYAVLRYGFAYSAASLAYKVIAPYHFGQSPPRLETDSGLDVLTVGIDESWRHVEVHHLPDHFRQFLFFMDPLTSEGFVHWGRGRYCATMDVETEIITLSEAPHQYHENNYKYLSTGRCLSLLVACGDLSWEVWEMKAETGEWRKALPNVDLGAKKCMIQQLAPKDAPRVLVPLGWVNYPQVLAFYFGEDIYHGCQWRPFIFYNLDTHKLHYIELPQSNISEYGAFPHKNNLTWLS
ncbi:putative F-box protein At5g62660 isoform X1 [Salvia miltiorrhiza]|uniref:putative F-box protein At5g62660 isoform X1 n=1 Tax=Salvia miltiorrhiza TaxID=226208 RepID=UPI0025ACCC93|nr:putative F-box protein At5g62660 isoform X1 [Salvia miltiorrhiza]